MTHMHIPDGILSVWLWLSGFLLMALVLAFSLYRLRGMDSKRKIPLLGALSAAMLVTMSLETFPIATILIFRSPPASSWGRRSLSWRRSR